MLHDQTTAVLVVEVIGPVNSLFACQLQRWLPVGIDSYGDNDDHLVSDIASTADRGPLALRNLHDKTQLPTASVVGLLPKVVICAQGKLALLVELNAMPVRVATRLSL